MTQISGISITRVDWLKIPETEQILFAAKLAKGLRRIHELDANMFVSDWASFVENHIETFIERQIAHGVNQKILDALPTFIEENLKFIPKNPRQTFMHGDVHFGNLRLLKTTGGWKILGLFDFADSRVGFHEYDFLAVGVLMFQGQRRIQREFFKSYGYAERT